MMKKITNIAGAVGTKLRDRSRSVKFRLLEIGRVARAKGSIDHDKLKRRYRQLLDATSRVVGQAKRFTASTAADTRAPSAWTAGSVSASSPTASSISVAHWKSRRLLKPCRPPSSSAGPPAARRDLRWRDQPVTMPQTSILRREVASATRTKGYQGQSPWLVGKRV